MSLVCTSSICLEEDHRIEYLLAIILIMLEQTPFGECGEKSHKSSEYNQKDFMLFRQD